MAQKPKKKIGKKKNKTDRKLNKSVVLELKKLGTASEFEHLETILTLTMRCIDGRSDQLDAVFKEQANKIYEQMEKLKE